MTNIKATIERGISLMLKSKYSDANVFFDKAIKLDPKNDLSWINKGLSLYKTEKYDEAIKCFTQAIELNRLNDYIWNYKGTSLNKLRKYDDALVCFDEAIKINPNNDSAWNGKGNTLIYLEKYEESIVCLNEAIKLNPHNKFVWRNKTIALAKLNRINDAICAFKKFKMSILDILVRYEEKLAKRFAYQMLDYDDFFIETTKEALSKDIDKYKIAYLQSLKIIKYLHVNKEEERCVSHYTQKTTSLQLLLHNSPFRLSSSTLLNDPKEGKTLFDYLYKSNSANVFNEEYGAFVGSFSFSIDCLNQFRLYGKQNNQEATGVSLVVNNNFFNHEIYLNTSLYSKLIEVEDEIEQDKTLLPLFRCIYIDPQTGRVIDVGHKEDYIFYRENNSIKDKKNKRI